MASVKSRTEIRVKVKNEPGAMASVLMAVSSAGCDLVAFCGFSTGPDAGEILMVANHDGKARKALEAAGFESESHKVIAVPTAAGKGAGAKIIGKLSERGINIEYAYAAAGPDGRSTAILRVPEGDLEKAIKAVS